jgi:hypothetical protein
VELLIGASLDFYSTWLDLEMLVNFGGRERTEDEYRRLLHRAGLRLKNLIATDSPISIMECIPA